MTRTNKLPPVTKTAVEHGLTARMVLALFVAVDSDGVQWDAEERLGLDGASFWAVLDALRGRHIVDADYCLTQFGRSLRRLLRGEVRGAERNNDPHAA